jgi:hypothetical protein
VQARRTIRPIPRTLFILIAVILGIFPIGRASAIADPTTINIENIRAYSGVLQANDILVLVKYDLTYTSTPDEQINDAYLGRFLSGTTEINSVEPFTFNNKGYGAGAFSFYWTAAQAVTDGLTFAAIDNNTFGVTFLGNIGAFSGTVPTTTSNTITKRDATKTLETLQEDVEELARQLHDDISWTANSAFTLISTGSGQDGRAQLTSNGEDYFGNVIPRLATMIPNLFESATTTPTFIDREFDDTYKQSIEQFWKDTWLDTIFINLATKYKMDKIIITTIAAFVAIMAIGFGVTQLYGASEKTYDLGLMSMAITLPIAIYTGFVSQTVGMIAGLLAAMALAWTFWGRRSGG